MEAFNSKTVTHADNKNFRFVPFTHLAIGKLIKGLDELAKYKAILGK